MQESQIGVPQVSHQNLGPLCLMFRTEQSSKVLWVQLFRIGYYLVVFGTLAF